MTVPGLSEALYPSVGSAHAVPARLKARLEPVLAPLRVMFTCAACACAEYTYTCVCCV